MNKIKDNLRFAFDYVKAFAKWFLLALIVGAIGGLIGSAFHISVDYVTGLRTGEYKWLIYLLPLGGLAITAIYHIFKKYGHIDTNRVIESVQRDEKVPLVMIPLIFVSTVITHMLGGSAGREGAALQLGGSIGYNFGRLFRLKEHDLHIIVMAGMSSVFAALFGTPLTAAVFALEVTSVGVFHYAALLPCIISAISAYEISLMFGIPPVSFDSVVFSAISFELIFKVILLALLCALVSILFCTVIGKCEHLFERLIKNRYIRAFIGGGVILGLTLLVGSQDYNGAGMNIITAAISGEAHPEMFVLKILFTAVTIASGFKGGEIVPSFFIGSTFGCVVGTFLGLDPGFSAALGFVALFCGVVNCPIASIFLSIEVFGAQGLLFFAVVCAVSYMMSGCFGLYKSQKILYSKLDDEFIDVNAR